VRPPSSLVESCHETGDFSEQFTGKEAKRSAATGQPIAGLAMQKDTPLGRLERCHASCQQARDNAG
jgi:hypothetical protein